MELQQALGVASYQTAWAWLHKLRREMAPLAERRLSGLVEVGAASIGGRAAVTGLKTRCGGLVALAVGVRGRRLGRARMEAIAAAKQKNLGAFVTSAVEARSTVRTGGSPGPRGLKNPRFRHVLAALPPDLLGVHRVAEQLSQWPSATLHGTVRATHLPGYLDGFAFRFNHRTARSPGPRFGWLLERAVRAEATPYRRLVRPGGQPDATWPKWRVCC
ncbi:ISXO2-like transposase domain protein [Pirellulimonas nuda]|uniref:ISXO2-like transposase domain protein n=1 Tax=Pirellulimonas nuda TaxID=2528009 RepID=A0A518D903_9BACT|nr:ISXO2-like transposase domain protein [Pirellulimonas nuda]